MSCDIGHGRPTNVTPEDPSFMGGGVKMLREHELIHDRRLLRYKIIEDIMTILFLAS